MELSATTNNGSQSVASRSTESLKILPDLGLQSDRDSRQLVLQVQTLEDQFESSVALCKDLIEEALESANISTYAKTCFHPIARKIDDELLRLEIWAFDFGTKDGTWKDFSALATTDVALGSYLRTIFENLSASLENIGKEMKLIQSIIEEAARHAQNPNDHWTTQVGEAVSRVDGNIVTLSSAVRKFISQRNLPSLIEAIKSDKNPYDEFSYDSDDTLDSLESIPPNRQYRIKTIQTEKNEQNIKLQKKPDEKPQWKKEDVVPSSLHWAKREERREKGEVRRASAEDNLNPRTELHPVVISPPRFEPRFDGGDNTDIIGLYDKDSSDGEKNTDSAWKSCNLLSLDGDGIRGYWSLLVIERLMELIATEEERIAEEEVEEGGEEINEQDGKNIHHSFWPQPLPDNVSQLPSNRELHIKSEKAQGHGSEAGWRSIPAARRYLPCHYFDYICGSSTGSLIAIMLGRFRMTVPDCMMEYENLGDEVYSKPRFFNILRFGLIDRPKYNAANVKEVFEDVTRRRSEKIGNGQRITFPSKRGLCKTFVTSNKSESGQPALETLFLIRSYDHFERTSLDHLHRFERNLRMLRSEIGSSTLVSNRSNIKGPDFSDVRKEGKPLVGNINYGPANDFEIWEVAKAATAAPFYFDPLKIDIRGSSEHMILKDAGFGFYNNPTEQGINEIELMHGTESIGIVVSVGTLRRDEHNLKSGLMASKSKSYIPTFVEIATAAEHVHTNMEAKSAMDGFPYYRLNDSSGLGFLLDEWEPKTGKGSGSETLKRIRFAFDDWTDNIENRIPLKNCAEQLVRCRRARLVNRAKWERYATGAEFICRVLGCQREKFDNCEQFQEHLTRDHDVRKEDQLRKEVAECRRDWQYQSAPQGKGSEI